MVGPLKNISVEEHNTHIRDLFRDTLDHVKGLSEEEIQKFQRNPGGFLGPYLLPIARKGKQPADDVIARAMAPFDPTRCHARIWNGGYGCQCSRKHGGKNFCGKHMKHHKMGLYNGPKPEDVQWKILPKEEVKPVPEVDPVPEVEEVREAPKAAKVIADRWRSAIVIQKHVREWLGKGKLEKKEVEEVNPEPAEVKSNFDLTKVVSKMKVAELRERLRCCNLSEEGKKKELVARLTEYLATKDDPESILSAQEVIVEKPKKRQKKGNKPDDIVKHQDEEKKDKEVAQEVIEKFDQLEADPEKYVETEEFVYEDVVYIVEGDDVYDKQNPTRKVGTVDLDEDIIFWLSPEFEKEHQAKRGDEPDLSDISDDE